MILRSQSNRQHVGLAAEVKFGRQIECETAVPVRPASQLLPVQPDHRIRHGPVELDAEITVPRAFGKGESLAVPARAGDRKCPGMRVLLGIKGPGNRPIVRQTQCQP